MPSTKKLRIVIVVVSCNLKEMQQRNFRGPFILKRKRRHHCCASTQSSVTIKETSDQTMQKFNSTVVAVFQLEAAAFTTSLPVASNSS